MSQINEPVELLRPQHYTPRVKAFNSFSSATALAKHALMNIPTGKLPLNDLELRLRKEKTNVKSRSTSGHYCGSLPADAHQLEEVYFPILSCHPPESMHSKAGKCADS